MKKQLEPAPPVLQQPGPQALEDDEPPEDRDEDDDSGDDDEEEPRGRREHPPTGLSVTLGCVGNSLALELHGEAARGVAVQDFLSLAIGAFQHLKKGDGR